MAHDVFISYSSKDKTVADAVCAKLESQKIRCWIAPRDVPAGQTWAAAIVNAIKTSRVLVLVLSEGSNNSVQVIREVGEAVDNAIPIIPFRIENVEPSDEMRYFIKSIHWLDAMNPPLERDLHKLSESVDALLSVGREEQPPPTVEKIAIEAPARKSRAMPVWGIALLIVFAINILGGVGAWILNQQEEDPLARSTLVSSEVVVEATIQSQPLSASGEEWRTLNFIIPSETHWRQENGSYTYIAKPKQDTIAWSDEIVEGDFILSAQVTSEQPDGIAHIIVYGDGVGYSKGCLIFTYQEGYISIESDTLYDDGDVLVFSGGDGFQEPTHELTIEIKEGAANFYVDGKKVAFSFLPPETKSLGRVGLSAVWTEPVGVTYSEIKITP